jgi:hypothetical protein
MIPKVLAWKPVCLSAQEALPISRLAPMALIDARRIWLCGLAFVSQHIWCAGIVQQSKAAQVFKSSRLVGFTVTGPWPKQCWMAGHMSAFEDGSHAR